MKKVISLILVFIIFFNFIFVNMSYAEPATITQDSLNNLMNEGVAEDENGNKKELKVTESVTGTLVGLWSGGTTVIPMIGHIMLTLFANDAGYFLDGEYSAGSNLKDGGIGGALITIEKVIFGKYYITSIDNEINKDNVEQKVDKGIIKIPGYFFGDPNTLGLAGTLMSIRENTYLWFYILRIISLIISMLTLIYIGIRIAISTVASEQARYKKMLMAWVESLFIILILPYIITLVLKFNNLLVGWAVKLKDTFILNGEQSFEASIIDQIFSLIKTKSGFTVAVYMLVYWFLVFIEFKFFLLYIKRVFVVAFLIIISPLISVTYSIDKAGDGKAQAFTNWRKEFFTVVFLQTLHVFTYLVFMFLAGNIAETVPIVGIAFLFALSKIEKIVKIIFDLRGATAIKDFDDQIKLKGK